MNISKYRGGEKVRCPSGEDTILTMRYDDYLGSWKYKVEGLDGDIKWWNEGSIKELGVNPGIKRTVKWLQEHAFDTIDSGDGKTHDFACDRPNPYVVIRVKPEELITETDRLTSLLRYSRVRLSNQSDGGIFIQSNYCPVDGLAFIDLNGLTDAIMFGE